MNELANDRKLNISNVEIHKRTFEGKYDETKNNNAITSKYRTSYKYAVAYDIEDYTHNPTVHCVITKKDAERFVQRLGQIHNLK